MSLNGKVKPGYILTGRVSEVDYLLMTAYGVALKNGFVGTEEEWLESLIGDNAYDYAVAAGYVGTEEEFYDDVASWAGAVRYTKQSLTEAQQVQARENIGIDEAWINTIAEVVKEEVPLVKVAEQPTFVDSIDEMTDVSKVYVLISDLCFYAYKTQIAYTLTADDFIAGGCDTDGSVTTTDWNTRIVTEKLWPLSRPISVSCPEPYQYFVYYYTDETTDSYIGKTSWKSGDIADVSADTVASGTSSGANYCRISLRDSTDTNADLTDRIAGFMKHITVTQGNDTEKEWRSTGMMYNQPADYEERIVALESALEGLEYGTY